MIPFRNSGPIEEAFALYWKPKGGFDILPGDLLAEDWSALGSVHEMGLDTSRFFHQELGKSWGSAHLAVFDDEEAGNWILGVSVAYYVFNLMAAY